MMIQENKALDFFKDPPNPTMSELVNWFQIEFAELALDMKLSNHNAVNNEPNPYHLEDNVWTHTMMVCLRAQDGNNVVKLTALLHDVGKPYARDVIPFGAPKPDYNGEGRATTKEHSKHGREIKTIFRGHEGISFWFSIDVLNRLMDYGIITEKDMNEVLQHVSLHGSLFNRLKDGREHKPEQVVNMFDDIIVYKDYIDIVRNDSTGRFHVNENSRSDTGALLGTEIYTEDIFYKYINEDKLWDANSNSGKPMVTVLVGLPCAGKSTFLNNIEGEHTVISKDLVILEMGEAMGLSEYSDIYKKLTDTEHKEAYKVTMERFHEAVMRKENIYIDLTNMSKKSRNKYIHQLKNYTTRAIVFVTGQEALNYRNALRAENEGKHIPRGVYKNMMMSFITPTLYEFDVVEYFHSR